MNLPETFSVFKEYLRYITTREATETTNGFTPEFMQLEEYLRHIKKPDFIV